MNQENTSSSDHSEHDAKHATNKWFWDGYEESSDLGENAEDHHYKSASYNDASASDLSICYTNGVNQILEVMPEIFQILLSEPQRANY